MWYLKVMLLCKLKERIFLNNFFVFEFIKKKQDSSSGIRWLHYEKQLDNKETSHNLSATSPSEDNEADLRVSITSSKRSFLITIKATWYLVSTPPCRKVSPSSIALHFPVLYCLPHITSPMGAEARFSLCCFVQQTRKMSKMDWIG